VGANKIVAFIEVETVSVTFSARIYERAIMQLSHLRYIVRSLMMAVATVALVVVGLMAFDFENNGAMGVLVGWISWYCIPVVLIICQRLPPKKIIQLWGTILCCGLPLALLFGLFCSAMSGLVGLIGGFVLALLAIGWLSLFGTAVWMIMNPSWRMPFQP
jgi:hypothetical protein